MQELSTDYCIGMFKGEYSWLSNMTSCTPFIYEGISYNTVENFYQAQKSESLGLKLQISKLSPYDAKSYGKAVKIRKDWESVKDDVMKKGLEFKFNQPKFKNLLINTGKSELIEGNYWNDTYWGWSIQKAKGQNKLGNFIMEIRTKFFEELDRQQLPIDDYKNIRTLLNQFDYKHMDTATIRLLQNEFILKYDESALLHFEEYLNDALSLDDIEKELQIKEDSDKIHVLKIDSDLLKMIKVYKSFLVEKNFTVNLI